MLTREGLSSKEERGDTKKRGVLMTFADQRRFSYPSQEKASSLSMRRVGEGKKTTRGGKREFSKEGRKHYSPEITAARRRELRKGSESRKGKGDVPTS